MSSEKRKAQRREAAKRIRNAKKEAGYQGFSCQILPQWRKKLMDVLKELKNSH